MGERDEHGTVNGGGGGAPATGDDRVSTLLGSLDRPMSERLRGQARDVARRCFGETPDAGAVLADGQAIGSYVIERVLGSGGQAVVYQARHRHIPERRVAIKVPHGEASRRMVTEARALASLHHPGIVSLIDLTLDGERPYVVLEFCPGGSLADLVEAEGALPEAQVVGLARGILGALSHAHERGIVHRDLKPENILLDADERPRIADFGIGKVVAEEMSASLSRASQTGMVGTPLYLAPEQERPGAPVDGRTDLYAFGKLLYFMLTGESPRAMKPIERVRSSVSPRWTEIIYRLVEEDPAARHPDAAAVLRDIEVVVGAAEALREVEPPLDRGRAAVPRAGDAPTPRSAAGVSGEAPQGVGLPFRLWLAAVLFSWILGFGFTAEGDAHRVNEWAIGLAAALGILAVAYARPTARTCGRAWARLANYGAPAASPGVGRRLAVAALAVAGGLMLLAAGSMGLSAAREADSADALASASAGIGILSLLLVLAAVWLRVVPRGSGSGYFVALLGGGSLLAVSAARALPLLGPWFWVVFPLLFLGGLEVWLLAVARTPGAVAPEALRPLPAEPAPVVAGDAPRGRSGGTRVVRLAAVVLGLLAAIAVAYLVLFPARVEVDSEFPRPLPAPTPMR